MDVLFPELSSICLRITPVVKIDVSALAIDPLLFGFITFVSDIFMQCFLFLSTQVDSKDVMTHIQPVFTERYSLRVKLIT